MQSKEMRCTNAAVIVKHTSNRPFVVIFILRAQNIIFDIGYQILPAMPVQYILILSVCKDMKKTFILPYFYVSAFNMSILVK